MGKIPAAFFSPLLEFSPSTASSPLGEGILGSCQEASILRWLACESKVVLPAGVFPLVSVPLRALSSYTPFHLSMFPSMFLYLAYSFLLTLHVSFSLLHIFLFLLLHLSLCLSILRIWIPCTWTTSSPISLSAAAQLPSCPCLSGRWCQGRMTSLHCPVPPGLLTATWRLMWANGAQTPLLQLGSLRGREGVGGGEGKRGLEAVEIKCSQA